LKIEGSRPPDFSVLATNLPEVFSYPDKVIEQRHHVSFFERDRSSLPKDLDFWKITAPLLQPIQLRSVFYQRTLLVELG
jgi:hypothetical protein